MANFGQRTIHDASKNPKGPRAAFRRNGEKQLEIRPAGIVERMVDPSGHIMSIQLSSGGAPNPLQNAEIERRKKHLEGFVEYGRCPIRSGIRHDFPLIGNDITEMLLDLPESQHGPCAADPKVVVKSPKGGFEWAGGCHHIEALRAYRTALKAEENASRNASRVELERQAAEKNELVAIQLQTAKEQLAQTRAKRLALDEHGNPPEKVKTK